MIYLRQVKLKHLLDIYPYDLPSFKDLSQLDFKKSVTFFSGENGSGKSTLLEAIAIAYGFNPEGGTRNFDFSTLETHSGLWQDITLVKGTTRAKDGFFLRAESFYNLSSCIDDLDTDPENIMGRKIIESYGGKSLHTISHGESFLNLIIYRFGESSLYLLDEPEAALSPTGQFTLLKRIHDLSTNGYSQFIIATHSPILLSYPYGCIYEFNDDGIEEKLYQETSNYALYHRFLNDATMVERIVSKED